MLSLCILCYMAVFDNLLRTHQVLIHVVIVIHKYVPVPEVGVEPTISKCEFFLVKAEVPLADNARFVPRSFRYSGSSFPCGRALGSAPKIGIPCIPVNGGHSRLLLQPTEVL